MRKSLLRPGEEHPVSLEISLVPDGVVNVATLATLGQEDACYFLT